MNALVAYLSKAWYSVMEEWLELENVKADVVLKLKELLNEDPLDPPSWWNEDCKTDSEGALLCLLMTGVSEPGVIKWFTEKFVTVVCVTIGFTNESKIRENGRREY